MKYVHALVVTSAATLIKVCHEQAFDAGWWIDTETGEDVRTWPNKFLKLWIATKLCLIHSEVSEALEGHRKDLTDDHLPNRKSIEVELADALIRICDLAGGLNLDLAGAVVDKLVFNAQRVDHKIETRSQLNGKSF